MYKYLIIIIFCLVLIQCAKPIADFSSSSYQDVVPAQLIFKNDSKSSDDYQWKVNGIVVSEDKDLDHCFYESGKHDVTLLARSGSKHDSIVKEIVIRPSTTCRVLMKTSHGDLILELSEETPLHLKNFIELTESGFYHGLQFHRIIRNFMVQAGDIKSRRSGKRSAEPEEIDQEIMPELHHVRGALAAARNPDEMNPEKRSSGSQFYIVDGAEMDEKKLKRIRAEKLFEYSQDQIQSYYDLGGAPQLDGEYTVFGRLIKGFEVLDKIAGSKTDKFDKPTDPIIILETKVLN